MSAFPKYHRYKDSGVEWLGEIPEHWDVESLRAAVSLKADRNRPDLPVLSVYREYGVIPKDSRDDNHNATSLDTTNYKVVEPGDLAVNKMKAWQGSLGVSEYHGIVSPAYITCSLNRDRIEPRYLHYLLRSKPFAGAFDSLSYGVRVGQWDMRFEDFKKVGITIPKKPEQDRIVTFLDRKTAEIDALIAKKKRQIELLDEQKNILINRAVTRGLNPDAKLKPSGIEWIGEIPEGWEVKRLGAVATFNSGGTPTKDREEFWGGKTPWVSPKDMKRPEIDCSLDTITERAIQQTNLKLLPAHSVLLVVRGMILQRYVPIAINTVPVTINQDMKGLVIGNTLISPQYLSMLLTACQESLAPLVEESGHGTKCIRTDTLKAILIPNPSIQEQNQIVKQVRELAERSSEAKDGIHEQIKSLKSLRSNLIAHGVTGRLKI